MGFMRGVSFFWSLNLFHILIFNMVILLFVFYQIDKRSYRKDIANGRKPDIRKPGTQFRLDGLHNIIFLVMIVGAVILSGVLPGMSAFQDAAGNVRGIHLFGEVTLTRQQISRSVSGTILPGVRSRRLRFYSSVFLSPCSLH